MNHFTRLLPVLSAVVFSAACAPPPAAPNIEATVQARVEGTTTALAVIATAAPLPTLVPTVRPTIATAPSVRTATVHVSGSTGGWATAADSPWLEEQMVFAGADYGSEALGQMYITEHAVRVDVGTRVRVLDEHASRVVALVEPMSGPYAGQRWYMASIFVAPN